MTFFALLFVNLRAHSPSPLALPPRERSFGSRRDAHFGRLCDLQSRAAYNDSLRIEVQADYQVGIWEDQKPAPSVSRATRKLL
jgi:hypothetical protein